jgi:hypothetical protein
MELTRLERFGRRLAFGQVESGDETELIRLAVVKRKSFVGERPSHGVGGGAKMGAGRSRYTPYETDYVFERKESFEVDYDFKRPPWNGFKIYGIWNWAMVFRIKEVKDWDGY